MSYRDMQELSSTTTVFYGSDHAVGRFFEVCDSRYADHPSDEQGEGYVLQWDALFKFGMGNLIGMTEDEIKQCIYGDWDTVKAIILPKVEKFIASLPPVEEEEKKSPYCEICERVIPDDILHCEIFDCPHRHDDIESLRSVHKFLDDMLKEKPDIDPSLEQFYPEEPEP